MIDPEAITEAKRALGRQLAACREAAGFNQHQLAPLIHFGRSTIAQRRNRLLDVQPYLLGTLRRGSTGGWRAAPGL